MVDYRVGDRLLPNISGYVPFEITAIIKDKHDHMNLVHACHYSRTDISVERRHGMYNELTVKYWLDHGDFNIDLAHRYKLELEQDIKETFNGT